MTTFNRMGENITYKDYYKLVCDIVAVDAILTVRCFSKVIRLSEVFPPTIVYHIHYLRFVNLIIN